MLVKDSVDVMDNVVSEVYHISPYSEDSRGLQPWLSHCVMKVVMGPEERHIHAVLPELDG
jgi:hypothetical protein